MGNKREINAFLDSPLGYRIWRGGLRNLMSGLFSLPKANALRKKGRLNDRFQKRKLFFEETEKDAQNSKSP